MFYVTNCPCWDIGGPWVRWGVWPRRTIFGTSRRAACAPRRGPGPCPAAAPGLPRHAFRVLKPFIRIKYTSGVTA